ncbi:MAG: single-stranded-DNA-specific exonuclease RecJ [Wenzhouxiangellaceae bacterium]|nr:single-stranded-DNA-specific exonuclease RecJ [Wenzhouxiangellaceae bacterium]
MIRRARVVRRRPAGSAPVSGCGSPVVARALAARGCSRVPDYSLAALLPPTLSGLDRAAGLLANCIEHGRRIVVVGDFDADGATGTALAVRGLKGLGAGNVGWRMPDRVRHGYGLSVKLAEECLAEQPALVVTVDHGISSHQGVARLRAAGIDVVVTDHHLPGPGLPDASAIVNPNCDGDEFPSRHLAGVGVMFYTLIALRAELRRRGRPADFRLDSLLDLVALGTVADLVKLDENNRRMVYQGLRRIRDRRCQPGVAALLEVAGRNLAHVSASDLGFVAGPRLNAAGRLDDISIGIRCLLADDFDRALEHARTLDELNRERQQIQADMTVQARSIADDMLAAIEGTPGGYCLYDPDWHPGVVGLVASRICEHSRRPVIALAPAGDGSDEWKGSCRSPEGVHMRDLLAELDARHPELIDRFGGHARAAGLSIAGDRLDALREAFDAQVAALEFAPDRVFSDGELLPAELTLATAQALADAGPWGQGWEEPLFDGRFRVLERRVVGNHHLKLVVEPAGGGAALDAIAFRAGDLCHNELPDPFHVTYRLEINRWRGNVAVQINIQHLVGTIDPNTV